MLEVPLARSSRALHVKVVVVQVVVVVVPQVYSSSAHPHLHVGRWQEQAQEAVLILLLLLLLHVTLTLRSSGLCIYVGAQLQVACLDLQQRDLGNMCCCGWPVHRLPLEPLSCVLAGILPQSLGYGLHNVCSCLLWHLSLHRCFKRRMSMLALVLAQDDLERGQSRPPVLKHLLLLLLLHLL